MTKEQMRDFILSEFAGVSSEILGNERVEIFRVNLEEVSKKAQTKIDEIGENLGDFEKETCERQIRKAENADDKNPIFAVLHYSDFPVNVEVKTGAPLAKILREKESVVPSKILDEREWSRIIGFGQVSAEEVCDLLRLSFRITTEE